MKDNRTLYPYGAFLPFRDSLENKWRSLLEEYSELYLDPIFVAERIGIDSELLPQVCYHHGIVDPYRPYYDPMDDDLYMIRIFESIEKDATLRGFGIRVKTKTERERRASETKPSQSETKPSQSETKPLSRVKESTKQSIERRTGRPIREFLEIGVSQGVSIRTLARMAGTSTATVRRLLMEMDIS